MDFSSSKSMMIESEKSWLVAKGMAERDYREFRLKVLSSLLFLGPLFGLLVYLISVSTNFQPLFWLFVLSYLVQTIGGVNLLNKGWSLWFMAFITGLMAGIGIFGASCFITVTFEAGFESFFVATISWILLIPIMWWWGSRIFCSKGEVKEVVLYSKRIDLEHGTYSPYHFPSGLFQAKWARSAVALSTFIGGAAIGLAVYLSHLVNSRFPEAEPFWGTLWGYLLVLFSVASISAPYHEWRWIWQWEKKTGRKMYIKEIIEYKRLKDRQRAERAKSSQN